MKPVLVAENTLALALNLAGPDIHFAVTVGIVLAAVWLADRMVKNPVGSCLEWEQWVDGIDMLLIVFLVAD